MEQIKLSDTFTYTKLIRFTSPTIFMMIFVSIYAVIDGIFVANFVSESAFASVNIIFPMLMILGSVGFMFGTGGAALVSKNLGESKEKLANKNFSMLTYTLIGISSLLTILGLIFIEPIALFLGANEETLANTILYGQVLLLFLVPFALMNYFQSFFSVAEKPKLSVYVFLCAGLGNILGDFILIYLCNMGITGAALATGISQAIAGLFPLYYFAKNKTTNIKLGKPHLHIKNLCLACTNGLSEMLTNVATCVIIVIFNVKLLDMLGNDEIVAYGVVIYLFYIFSGIYQGFAFGVAPILAYKFGAKDSDGLKNVVRKSCVLLCISSLVITSTSILFAPQLASLFVEPNSKLHTMTITALQLFNLSYLFMGCNMFVTSLFTSLQKGLLSAFLSVLRTFILQLAMVAVLPIMLATEGIWLSVPCSELLAFLVSGLCFWKLKKKYKY